MASETQNFQNHKRLVPLFHFVTFGLLLAVIVGGIVLAFIDCPNNVWPGTLIAIGGLASTLAAFFGRVFALKAQDRAIRAEENFRHYLLTSKPLPIGLKIGQIVALRFASDEEFPALTARALKENLDSKSIKQSIKNWRGDYHRA